MKEIDEKGSGPAAKLKASLRENNKGLEKQTLATVRMLQVLLAEEVRVL